MPTRLLGDASGPAAPSPSAAFTCPQCGGSGWQRVSQYDRKRCPCRFKEDAIAYLTPTYADPRLHWDRDLDIVPLAGRNVVITKSQRERSSDFQFRSLALVKSFLLNTWRDRGMRYSHQTLTPYGAVQLSWNDFRENKLGEPAHVDLLIFRFSFDPGKKPYDQVLPWLLSARQAAGRPTWVLTELDPSDADFHAKYTKPVAAYLNDTFDPYMWGAA